MLHKSLPSPWLAVVGRGDAREGGMAAAWGSWGWFGGPWVRLVASWHRWLIRVISDLQMWKLRLTSLSH